MWFPTVTFMVFLQIVVAFGHQQAFVIKNKKTGKVLDLENRKCKMTEWSNKNSQIWSLEATNKSGHYMLRNVGNKEYLRYYRDYSNYNVWKLNIRGDTQIQIEAFKLLLADREGIAKYIFEEPDDDTDRWLFVEPKFMKIPKPFSNAQGKVFVIKNKKTGKILDLEDHICKLTDWNNKTSQMWTLEDTNQSGHFQIRNVEHKEYLRYIRDYSEYNVWKLNIQGDTQIQMEDFDLLLADKDGKAIYIFEEPNDDTDSWLFVEPKFMKMPKPFSKAQSKIFVIKNKKTGKILDLEDHICKLTDWNNKTSQMWTLEDTNQSGHFQIRNVEHKEYLRYIRDYSEYNVWKLNIQGDTQIQMEDFDLLLADKDGKAIYIFEEPNDDTDRWLFVEPKFMKVPKPFSKAKSKIFVIKNKKTGKILDLEDHICKLTDWNNKTSQMWTLEDTNQTGHFHIRNVEHKEYLRYIRDYSEYNVWKLNIQGDTQIQMEDFDLLLADKDGKAIYIFEEPNDDTDRWFFVDPKFMKMPKPFSKAQSKIFVIKNKKTGKILDLEDHICKLTDWNNKTSQMWTLEDTNQSGHFQIRNVEHKEYLRYIRDYSEYNVWKLNIQGDTQIQMEDFDLLLADKDGKAIYIFEEPNDDTDRWLFVEPKFMKVPKPFSKAKSKIFVIKNKKTGKILDLEDHICKLTDWNNKTSQMWTLEDTNQSGHFQIRNVEHKEYLRYIRDYSEYNVWKLNIQGDTQIQMEDFDLLLADKDGKAIYIFEEPNDDTDRWLFVESKFMKVPKPFSKAKSKIFVIKNKKTGKILDLEDHICKLTDWNNKTSQMWTLEDTNQTGHFQIRNVDNKEYLRYFRDYSDYNVWKLNIQGDTQIQIEDFDLLLADKDGIPKYIFEEPDDDTDRWLFVDPKFIKLPKPISHDQGKKFVIKNKKTGEVLDGKDHKYKMTDWNNKPSQLWTLEDINKTGRFIIRNEDTKEYLTYYYDYPNNMWKLDIPDDTRIQKEEFGLFLVDEDDEGNYSFEEIDDKINSRFFPEQIITKLPKIFSPEQVKNFVIKNKKTGKVLDVKNHKYKITEWNNKTSQIWILEDTNQPGLFRIKNVETKEYLKYFQDYSDYTIWKLNIQGDTQIQIEDFGLLLADKGGKATYIFEEPIDDTDRWFFVDPKFMKVPKPFSNAQSKIFVIKNKKTGKILDLEDHICKLTEWNNKTSQMWTLEDTNQSGHFQIRNVEHKEYLRYIRDYSEYNVWKLNIQGDTQIQMEDFDLLLADKDGKAIYIFEEPNDDTDRWLFVEPKFMKIPKPFSNAQGKIFVIKNKKTGKILDLENHICKLTDWNNKTSQMWTLEDTNQSGYFHIRNVENKEYLRNPFDFSDYDLWKLNMQGNTHIQFENFGLLLADQDGKTKYIFEDPNDDTDRWLFVEPKFMKVPKPFSKAQGKIFVIKNKKTGKILDLENHICKLTDWNNKTSQMWTLEDTKQSGYFHIRNVEYKEYLRNPFDFSDYDLWKLNTQGNTHIQFENFGLLLADQDGKIKYIFEDPNDDSDRWLFVEPKFMKITKPFSNAQDKMFVIKNKKTGKILDLEDHICKLTDWNNKTSQMWTLEDTNQTGHFHIRNVENKEYLRYFRDYSAYNVWKLNIQGDTQIQIEDFDLFLADKDGIPKYIFEEPDDDTDRWLFVEPKFMKLPKPISHGKKFVIKNKKTGEVLDGKDHKYKMTDWNKKPSQLWTLEDINKTGRFIIRNEDTKEYFTYYYDYPNNMWKLDIPDDTRIQKEEFGLFLVDEDDEGNYSFEEIDDKINSRFFPEQIITKLPKIFSPEQVKNFVIKNKKTGKVLDVKNHKYKMTEWNNKTSQMWILEDTNQRGHFRIKNVETKEYLKYFQDYSDYTIWKLNIQGDTQIQLEDIDLVLADKDGTPKYIIEEPDDDSDRWLFVEPKFMKIPKLFSNARGKIFVIKNKKTGKILNLKNHICTLTDWNNKTSQMWTLEDTNQTGHFHIRNVENKEYLRYFRDYSAYNVWKFNIQGDTQIQIEDFDLLLADKDGIPKYIFEEPDDDTDRWLFVEPKFMKLPKPISHDQGKKFVIKNKKTGEVLDGKDHKYKMTEWNNKPSQLWTLEDINKTGRFIIRNMDTEEYLTYYYDYPNSIWRLDIPNDTQIQKEEFGLFRVDEDDEGNYNFEEIDDNINRWFFIEQRITTLPKIFSSEEIINFVIKNKKTGKVLDLKNHKYKLTDWNNKTSQMWILEDTNQTEHFRIKNVENMEYLRYLRDYSDYNVWKLNIQGDTQIQIEDFDLLLADRDGTPKYIFEEPDDDTDRWLFVEPKFMKLPKPISSDQSKRFVIKNNKTGKILDVKDHKYKMTDWNNKPSQLWTLEDTNKTGRFIIRNVDTKEYLTYYYDYSNNIWKLDIPDDIQIQMEEFGLFLVDEDDEGNDNFKKIDDKINPNRWFFIEQRIKTLPKIFSTEQIKNFVIKNKKTGRVLDVKNHKYKMTDWKNKTSQMWILEDTNQTGHFRIKNVDNREYLTYSRDHTNYNIWKMNIQDDTQIQIEDFGLLLVDDNGEPNFLFEEPNDERDSWFFVDAKLMTLPKPLSNEQSKRIVIRNRKTGKVLDIEDHSYKMTEWNNKPSQTWILEGTNQTGQFILRNTNNKEYLRYYYDYVNNIGKLNIPGNSQIDMEEFDLLLANKDGEDGVAQYISGNGEGGNIKWLLMEIELIRNIVKPKSIYVESPINQFVIENKRTGMVLDGENTKQLEEWSNKNSQLWTLEPQNKSGHFLIRNVATNAVLTQVKDGVEHLLWKINPNNDTLIQVQDPNGYLVYENGELVIINQKPNDDQGKWQFVKQTKMVARKHKSIYIPKPPKKFVIENKKSGLVLDGYQKHLKLNDYAAKDSQLWTLKEQNQSGYYVIQNVANRALVAYNKNSTQYDVWKLKTDGDTYIEIPEQDISLSQRFRYLVYSQIEHNDENGIWLFLDPSELNATNPNSIYVNKEKKKFAIESKDTGMVLDVSQNVLKLSNWKNSDDQLWFLEPQNKSGHYLIRNVARREILTYPGSTTEYQIWKLDTSGETRIQIADSDIFLAHKRGRVTYTGSKQSDGSDEWYLVEQKSGKGIIKPKPTYVVAPQIEYVIENKRSGLVLDAAQTLALEEWKKKDSQLWLLEPQKMSGLYFIRNVENGGVLSYPRNGTEHRTWKLNINNETYIQAEDVNIFLAQSYGRAIYSHVKRNDENYRWIILEKSKKTDPKPNPVHVQNENHSQLIGEVTSE